ncbi:putative signal peptide protein [Puccinia sorghi]|uniref:Putative signal peptide protein n=1 Tax=Puccinia sorghi TaxID=27349 RepID=A0A0L6V4T5_9BASI|nr:putative signal peptide protein [Puccinia sorghi]
MLYPKMKNMMKISTILMEIHSCLCSPPGLLFLVTVTILQFITSKLLLFLHSLFIFIPVEVENLFIAPFCSQIIIAFVVHIFPNTKLTNHPGSNNKISLASSEDDFSCAPCLALPIFVSSCSLNPSFYFLEKAATIILFLTEFCCLAHVKIFYIGLVWIGSRNSKNSGIADYTRIFLIHHFIFLNKLQKLFIFNGIFLEHQDVPSGEPPGMDNHHQSLVLSSSRISTSGDDLIPQLTHNLALSLEVGNYLNRQSGPIVFTKIHLSFNHSRMLRYDSKIGVKALILSGKVITVRFTRFHAFEFFEPPTLNQEIEIKAPKCEQGISPPHPYSVLGSSTPSLGVNFTQVDLK